MEVLDLGQAVGQNGVGWLGSSRKVGRWAEQPAATAKGAGMKTVITPPEKKGEMWDFHAASLLDWHNQVVRKG